MAKLTLNTIGSRYGSIDALNDNFDAIEQALENTFSLDGTSPNALEADLDMNSNDILNAGEINTDTLRINGVLVEPTTGITAGAAFQTYSYTATAGQTTFSVTPATPFNASIVVIVNGLQLSPSEISVSGTNVITPALTLGDEVVIRRYTSEPVAAPDASEINFIQAGTGAVTRTSQNKMRDVISIEDFGAVGDGVSDDTLAFSNAAQLGRKVVLRDNAIYLISSRINCVTGTRFVCPEGVCTVKFKTGSGGYSGTNLTISKDGASVCGFLFLSVDDVGLEGIRFTTDGVASSVIYPVRCNGGTAVKGCTFTRLEFVGFPVCNGGLLSLNSIGVGGYVVKNITGRSCGTSLNTWTGTPQITVFEIDNDMIGGVPSEPGYAENIRGIDVALTGAALSTYGPQTDVVNIAGISGTDRKGPTIYGVYGDNVGEVVDLFCSNAIIKGIRGRNVYNFCCKLVHGAQFNDIEIESIAGVGIAAVTFQGSSSLAIHTQFNNVRIGSCKITTDIGAAGKAAVVLFGDNGGTISTCLPRNNTVQVDNAFGDSAGLDYVVRDGSANNSNANFVEIKRFTGTWATQFCDAVAANVTVRYRQNPRTRMTVGTSQVLTSGVDATVQYNTIASGNDTDGGGDIVNYRVRPLFPGLKHVKAQIRATLNANDNVGLALRKNGVTIAQSAHEPTSGGLEYTYEVSCYIYISEDECGKVASDITVVANITSAGTITILNTSTMSYFEVVDIG